MKRILMSIGILLFGIGMAGYDSSIIISMLFMLIGGLAVVPYVKEFEREQEIEERRHKK